MNKFSTLSIPIDYFIYFIFFFSNCHRCVPESTPNRYKTSSNDRSRIDLYNNNIDKIIQYIFNLFISDEKGFIGF